MKGVLDTRYEEFVIDSVKQGTYSSENDVVSEAFFLLEEERKMESLREKLREGEMSGIVENFDPQAFLEQMRQKYL